MGEAEEGKLVAILMYLIFLVGLIWYLVDEKMKKNSFAKYHLKQSLILVIFWFGIGIVGSIIPILGWFIILPLGYLFMFVLMIIGIVNAAGGKTKPLPLIGKLGEKFKF